MKNKIFLKIVFIFLSSLFYLTEIKAQTCVGTAGQVTWNYWDGFTATQDTVDMFSNENFPNNPSGTRTLGSLSAPRNFTEYFVSFTRGFIKVPTTGNFYFNITGDDKVMFYLSTNHLPANKSKICEVKTYTNVGQNDKEPNQTSNLVTLTAGQYYYFEMLGFEGGYSDHLDIYWKPEGGTNWVIVDYNYIYDYACKPNCPARGTACNDGNAATTNDQEDGFCNCVGVYPTSNACVGERGLVEAYYYDNITGSYVENDLINAPKFPLLPDRKEKLKGAYGPLVPYTKDTYGTLVQGFLTVPVSATYEFVITGDNQTFFFLSKNDSIEYKQYHQALVMSGLDENDYTNSTFQKLAPLYLEKGKYYYFEFRHKENNWRDHFNLFWKTPFHEIKSWKRVPNFYLYDYKCEISCIPQGTPCDDGNPFTNNDQYNNNCECVGTPCSGANCNDLGAKYQLYDACAPTPNLVPIEEASWVSCSTSANPNPARSGNQHWIKYDFGNIYKLQGTRIWNYNVLNQTNKGFKTVAIDYSLDGTTWTTLGSNYTWNQASGISDYSGFVGPNFNDIKARYVLISAINNWGDATCSGFSKITFDAIHCDPLDTPCDDNDPLTVHDKFDNNCNCKGINIDCASDTLALGKYSLTENEYKAKKNIQSQSIVPSTKDITFTAGNSIVFLPGFETQPNVIFKTNIANCIQAAFIANNKANMAEEKADTSSVSNFTANTEETNFIKKIIFRLNKAAQIKLQLKDNNEKVIVTIIDSYYDILGTHTKLLPINRLAKGDYWIELQVDKAILREKLVVK